MDGHILCSWSWKKFLKKRIAEHTKKKKCCRQFKKIGPFRLKNWFCFGFSIITNQNIKERNYIRSCQKNKTAQTNGRTGGGKQNFAQDDTTIFFLNTREGALRRNLFVSRNKGGNAHSIRNGCWGGSAWNVKKRLSPPGNSKRMRRCGRSIFLVQRNLCLSSLSVRLVRIFTAKSVLKNAYRC